MPAKLKAGIFIDDSNIFYAQKTVGWKVDFSKLVNLLSVDVNIISTCYYLAIPEKWDDTYSGTCKYLETIKKRGFSIFTKPVKYIKAGSKIIKKGDVDIEIALDVVRNINKLDLFIVVSGDSDYIELRKYVLENHKKIIFACYKHNMAWELRKGKYLLFESIRELIEVGAKKTPRLAPRRILPSLY